MIFCRSGFSITGHSRIDAKPFEGGLLERDCACIEDDGRAVLEQCDEDVSGQRSQMIHEVGVGHDRLTVVLTLVQSFIC